MATDVRERIIALRLTDEEWNLVADAAAAESLPAATWVRSNIVARAKEVRR